jgi:hypothetical protein
LDFLSFNAERLTTMQTINRMESDQIRFEAGVDFENSVLYTANRRPGATVVDQRAMDLEALRQDQKGDLISRSGINKVVDNVHGSCVITEGQSMESVYSAMVLTLEGLTSGKTSEVVKGSIVRILPLGTRKLERRRPSSSISISRKFGCQRQHKLLLLF